MVKMKGCILGAGGTASQVFETSQFAYHTWLLLRTEKKMCLRRFITETIDMVTYGSSYPAVAGPIPAINSHPNRSDDDRRGLEAKDNPCNSRSQLSGFDRYSPHTLAESYCSMRAGHCDFRILSSYRCNRFAPVRHLLKRDNIKR
jgi:hypothetical protein